MKNSVHPRGGIKAGHLIALTVSILFTLAIVEAGLRILERLGYYQPFFTAINSAYTPFDVKTGEGLYYAHPYIGYDIKPGYSTPGGGVKINSLGFRGEEFEQKKPEGVYRIVALGGSTTYGTGLSNDETYPYFLQKELREQLGTDKIEVINAGLVSGSTAESLPRFLLKVIPLDPDLVIFYEGYNDLPPRMFNNYSSDYYHFRKIPDYTPGLLSHSLLYRVAASGFKASLHYPNTTLLSHTWKFKNLPEDDSKKIENFNNTSSAVYKRNLEHMILVALGKNIPIVISTFAINTEEPNWNDYMPDELWTQGISENNEAVRELAEKYDLPLIQFYEYGLENKEIFKDSIHMSAEGNIEMAEVFAETLIPIIKQGMDLPGEDKQTD